MRGIKLRLLDEGADQEIRGRLVSKLNKIKNQNGTKTRLNRRKAFDNKGLNCIFGTFRTKSDKFQIVPNDLENSCLVKLIFELV